MPGRVARAKRICKVAGATKTVCPVGLSIVPCNGGNVSKIGPTGLILHL